MTPRTPIALAALLAACGPASARDVLFPEGTGMFALDLNHAASVEEGEDLPSVGLAYDRFVIDNLSLGAELSGYAVFQDDDTAAVSLAGRLRHHVLARDDASLFLTVGIGPFYAWDETPAGGTRFNFASHAGLGTFLRLRGDAFLTLELDFWHLSNGQLVEEDNPAINGIQASVGVAFTL